MISQKGLLILGVLNRKDIVYEEHSYICLVWFIPLCKFEVLAMKLWWSIQWQILCTNFVQIWLFYNQTVVEHSGLITSTCTYLHHPGLNLCEKHLFPQSPIMQYCYCPVLGNHDGHMTWGRPLSFVICEGWLGMLPIFLPSQMTPPPCWVISLCSWNSQKTWECLVSL